MNQPTDEFSALGTLNLENRRSFGRYYLPVSLLAEACWNGRRLRLEYVPDLENISASGASLVLAQGPLPPVDSVLDISLPLVERPFQPGRTYARCRGRVVRQEGPNRVAVHFDDVDFVREERASGIPQTVFATA